MDEADLMVGNDGMTTVIFSNLCMFILNGIKCIYIISIRVLFGENLSLLMQSVTL